VTKRAQGVITQIRGNSDCPTPVGSTDRKKKSKGFSPTQAARATSNMVHEKGISETTFKQDTIKKEPVGETVKENRTHGRTIDVQAVGLRTHSDRFGYLGKRRGRT